MVSYIFTLQQNQIKDKITSWLDKDNNKTNNIGGVLGNLDFDHEGYRKLLPLKDFKHFIKHSDSKTRNHFIGMAFNNKTDVFSRNFSNKMINIFPKMNFIFIYNNFRE